MTSPSLQDVESAVWSVLAEIRSVPDRNGRGHGQGSSAGGEVFAERLFALRHAEGLPGATREVRIVPGTVVTPLARDHLKRRGIELRFVSEWQTDGRLDRGEWGFAIASESGLMTALRRAFLDGAEGWVELEGLGDAAARWVGESSRRGAMLMTDEASVAVWRACQFPGVRAAAVADIDAGARAGRRLGANLLVVEPSGKSISLLRQLGQTLRRSGPPRAPEWLEGEGMSCESPR